MNSKRLNVIASFIDFDNKVIDVGCDHGYLSIYLVKNKLCKKVLATDISAKALEFAKSNILKSGLLIDTKVSDGVKDIDVSLYDTLVIAGMGSHTIIKILNDEGIKYINKLVIQSNNDLELLRSEVGKLGFYLKDNKVILENDKYYEVMLFIRGDLVNDRDELEYGIWKEEYKEYYEYLVKKYKNILNKVKDSKNCKEKDDYLKRIEYYEKIH